MKHFKQLFQDYSTPTFNKQEEFQNLKLEISNMISVLEKTITLCLLQCLNSLLFTLLILPLKCLTRPNIKDILRLLILLSISLQEYFTMPVSRLYHDLKEQDFLKLNFVYNLIGITDQLLMAFGQRSLKQLGSSIENFLITLVYVWLHTFHLTLAVAVFEVALNSSRYNLLLVVMTSAVVETKITVFKKYDKKGILNIIYNDVVERLQIILYMFVIILKSYLADRVNIEEQVKGVVIVLFTSFLIDWLKHYFVMYFNKIPLDAYKKVYSDLKENWKNVYETGEFAEGEGKSFALLDPSCSLTLSYKFIALPQACMLLRTFSGILNQLSFYNLVKSYFSVSFFKLVINLFILLFVN